MKLLTKNRIFFDTEFYENGETIELISIGLVRQRDLATLYRVNKDFNYDVMVKEATKRNRRETIEFLDKNVFNNLGATTENTKTKFEIRDEIAEFVGNKPDFWASCSAYDWVLICQLFGVMLELPKSWPHFCNDIAMLKNAVGKKEIDLTPMNRFRLKGKEHNALYDACETYCKYLTYKKYFPGINL